MDIEKTSKPEPFGVAPTLQKAIAAANEAVIDLVFAAARSGGAQRDPVVAALLGMSDESLDEIERTPRFKLINATMLGAPIFTMRFSEPDVLRTLVKSGFSDSVVIREFTKNMPLPEITQSNRRVE